MNLRNRLHVACACLVALCAANATAEDPIPSDLAAADVPGYIGTWILTMEIMGQNLELFLTVADVDGKVGATIDSAQSPEPLAIANITRDADNGGLDMASELKFGGFAVNIEIDSVLEAGQLVGSIRESGSELFKSDFAGVLHTGDDDLVQGERPPPTETRFRLPGGKTLRVTFGNINTEHEDYNALQSLGDGKVYTYTSARATKMYTDTDIKFGDTVIKTGNVAANYPGVYSLWLRKTGDNWSLVFNEEPDIWGTRYDPNADVAEIPLEVHNVESEQEDFIVTIDEKDESGGVLKIAWGTHEWTASFTAIQ